MKVIRFAAMLAAFLSGISISNATITVLNSYHLGDLDDGASGGVTAVTSEDYIGTNAISFVGDPAYSTDVPEDYPLPDTYSLNFTGTNYGVASVLTNATDDFGIQAWVKVRSTGGNRVIAYNGSDGTNGWGLFLVGDTFQGGFGNVGFIGSAPVQTNAWTHLALVRDSGVATLYVNGIACGTSSASPIAPVWPDGALTLGASPLSPGGEFFDGWIDEAQVFTFAAFSTNDLAYRSPDSRKLSAALNGTNFIVTWPAVRSDMQLQYATDLASGVWTTMSYITNNSQFTAVDAPGDGPRFYRLVKPPASENNPVISRIPVIRHVVSTGVITTNFAAINNDDAVTAVHLNSGLADYTFDGSAAVNPRTGTAEAIDYHWYIGYLTVSGTFTDAGIHGYQRSRLHMDPHSLAQSFAASLVTVTLYISDHLDTPGHEQIVHFVAQVSSDLALSEWSTCQQNSPSCTIPAALPATDPNDPP